MGGVFGFPPVFIMSGIRFGEFELDEQTLEPARVLAYLLKHRGVLVTREQIRVAIWGEDTFVDFEQGLNFCIRQIRLALNDQAEKPQYIETLPRLGYRLIAAPESNLREEKKTEPVRRIRIGVLPIEDLGGGEDSYFSAGLTEDMISALSRIDPGRLRVTAGPRLGSGTPGADRLDQLQRELSLDFLLRGSVRRAGDTLRVTAQLHDLKDKCVLWSEHYDRRSADLLAVQEDVTRRVSQSLALELLPGTGSGSRKYSQSSAAYDAYLRGRYFWHRMTSDGIHNSLRYFNEALALDAGFAPAHAGLADCYAQMGSTRTAMMKPLEALDKARSHLQHAFNLDDTLAEAHCTLGLIKSWYDLDWAGAEREFQTALGLDPSQITALLWRSVFLCAIGRSDDALQSVRRAKEQEPLSVSTNTYLGVVLYLSGQYDLAIRQLHQAIELDPGYYRSRLFLGQALARARRYEEAVAAQRASLERNPDSIEARAFLGAALAATGDREGAWNLVEEVKAADSKTEPAILLAVIYAGLGDADKMFEWLQIALERKSVPLYIAVIADEFYPYRSDPRFRSFLTQIGLAQYERA